MKIRFEALVCNGNLPSISELEAVSYSGSYGLIEAQGQSIKTETPQQ